jgi:uncharacterized protein (TIGR00369 family)
MDINVSTRYLPVLEYLRLLVNGGLQEGDYSHFKYPTPISSLLGFRLVEIGPSTAVLEFDADAGIHGNQQGTVHGGILCELADAAIGTAHSTTTEEGESFTSVDLRTKFLRPVWNERLRARAEATHQGRTISHYRCDILREDGKPVAIVDSIVMTLRGEMAKGR